MKRFILSTFTWVFGITIGILAGVFIHTSFMIVENKGCLMLPEIEPEQKVLVQLSSSPFGWVDDVTGNFGNAKQDESGSGREYEVGEAKGENQEYETEGFKGDEHEYEAGDIVAFVPEVYGLEGEGVIAFRRVAGEVDATDVVRGKGYSRIGDASAETVPKTYLRLSCDIDLVEDESLIISKEDILGKVIIY